MKSLGTHGNYPRITSVRSSAGCSYSAGISLYSAHTGIIEGALLGVSVFRRESARMQEGRLAEG